MCAVCGICGVVVFVTFALFAAAHFENMPAQHAAAINLFQIPTRLVPPFCPVSGCLLGTPRIWDILATLLETYMYLLSCYIGS